MPDPDSSFYAQQNKEAPLDDSVAGYGRQIHRTSRHTPARRRENSNRATILGDNKAAKTSAIGNQAFYHIVAYRFVARRKILKA